MSDATAENEPREPRKPRKQEQEAARSEITEIAANVLRMELPIRMPGLGHVNCYALVDGQGAAVVDPGMPGPDSWGALKRRLKLAGLRVRDVHTVVVTHSHPDHFGGANRFVRESGAKVIAHRSFRFGVTSPPAHDHHEVSVDDLDAQREKLSEEERERPPERVGRSSQRSGTAGSSRTPWGGQPPRPPLRHRFRWQMMQLLGRDSWVPTISAPVKAGDVLRLAGREWFVVHTPGHTEDHICLHNREDGLFLAGDHVLPTITPHISGLSTFEDPLKEFFVSLDEAAALPDVKQALPAHGHPFDDLAGRCAAIKRHHDERLEKVREISGQIGPATVQAFSQRLFRQRSWGPMAESETFAHLEHLRILGGAEQTLDSEGSYLYLTG
jgi:glyoxylase-like metal-dependent hydrolase (beta-lactamase superfamily II)